MESDKQIDALLKKATATEDNLEKISYFEEVLRINPLHADALTRSAATYALLDRSRECLDFARRAVFVEPARANAWSLQEHALTGLGIKDKNLNQAICNDQLAWCDNYLSRHPDVVQAWYLKAFALAFLSRTQETLTTLDRALAIAPGFPDGVFLRGCILFDLGRKKEAVQTLAQAQKLGHPQAAETMKQVMQTMDSASLQELAGESQGGVGNTGDMDTAALRNEAIRKTKACFIATAAYGSPYAPEVALLREYRERILRRSRGGLSFICLYEHTSPPLANWIRRHPRVGALIARGIIAPLAYRAGERLKQLTTRSTR